MADPPDERKPVTVLFADIVGSTELATRQDPEQLRAMLAAFFEEMREQIQSFGGTVEKYAGDASMAVFGVPRVSEDDAERAVRAALGMRQSLEQLNPLFEKEYGVRLALRVGVATGEAVAATGTADQWLPRNRHRLSRHGNSHHRRPTARDPRSLVAHRRARRGDAHPARVSSTARTTGLASGTRAAMRISVSLADARLQETLRAQVIERAGGNPLFLEEIIRGLAEQGVLRCEGNTWVATGDVKRWAIPGTLRGVLAARIDGLPAEAKRALQRAAVVGRFFTHRALQALSDGDDNLERALAQLLRADLIRESGRDPERRYIFKHALVQDAAYASILAERRKGLHGTVARHIETALGELGDEHAAVLAHHWREAEEWEPALHHTLRAAARARALYARPEAVALHWQALELLARLPSTDARRSTYVDVVIELIVLPGWAGAGERLPEGVRHLIEAGRIAGEAGDETRLARVEAFQGIMQRDERLLLRAIERARRIGHHGAEAFALFRYLLFLGQVGRYTEALGHVGHLIEMYGAEGETFQQALTITAVGRCWAARAGHMDESLAYARRFRRSPTSTATRVSRHGESWKGSRTFTLESGTRC